MAERAIAVSEEQTAGWLRKIWILAYNNFSL
jgi:hypothetical protein